MILCAYMRYTHIVCMAFCSDTACAFNFVVQVFCVFPWASWPGSQLQFVFRWPGFQLQVVGDTLSLLPKRVAGVIACLLVCLACAFRFPVTWKKLDLGDAVQWLGWSILDRSLKSSNER